MSSRHPFDFPGNEKNAGTQKPRYPCGENPSNGMQGGVSQIPAVASAKDLRHGVNVVDSRNDCRRDRECDEQVRQGILDEEKPEELLITSKVGRVHCDCAIEQTH